MLKKLAVETSYQNDKILTFLIVYKIPHSRTIAPHGLPTINSPLFPG
jgi:hypothetical protein